MSHQRDHSPEQIRKRAHLDTDHVSVQLPVLNPCYCSSDALQSIRQIILGTASLTTEDGTWTEPATRARCFATPFPVLQLPHFFSQPNDASPHKFATGLQDELKQVQFQHRSNDLYDFYQSWDAQTLKGAHISGLRETIASAPILQLIETVLGVEGLQEGRVDMAAQRYENGGYLLCHDDDIKEEVEAGVARRVAFVYYLVDEAWTAQEGGELALFDTINGQPGQIVRRLVPERGALILFRVGETSWHQVEEVRSQLPGRSRWSVTGWLYGPLHEAKTEQIDNEDNKRLSNGTVQLLPQFTSLQQSTTTTTALDEWICQDYLIPAAKERILKQFTDESVVQLQGFLRADVRAKLAEAILLMRTKTSTAHYDTQSWRVEGPASFRRYSLLDGSTVNDSEVKQSIQLLNRFDLFLQSTKLAEYFGEITGLATNADSSGVFGQLRRIVHGNYTLLRDDWIEPTGLDALFYILASPSTAGNSSETAVHWPNIDDDKKEWQGAYHYINTEDGDLLATLPPTDNALTLVYRDEGVSRFLKYSLQEDACVERLDAIYTYAVHYIDDDE
ncbi:Oxoglutarate and iron-dependent oxygenase degradation C-term-domain-containing protein [Syncephalis fuscata]|nr:Oxoglutarate and iron-dependent oxygenase degradation C-term-domain-containing protein [Syncephalis fuscata]